MSDGGKKKPSTSSLFHLIAGLASGATSSLLLQPADLLKTRLQQSPTSTLLSTIRSITSSSNPLRQLWRGTLPSTIRTSVGSALYFTSLNKLRTALAQSGFAAVTTTTPQRASNASSSALPKLSPSANLASGAFARAAVGFVMMPITVLKVRYESNFYAYRSLWAASTSIFRAEGLRGFFAGFGATAIRDAPYAGLYVVAYERGKEVLGALVAPVVDSEGAGGTTVVAADGSTQVVAPTKKASALLLPTINFSAGALAAAVATAITNPPDAVKTRLQLQPAKYHNTWQATRKMLREEGVRSLFDGLGLRMVRKALSSAIAWCVYEEVIRRGEGGWLTKG